jgi:hypothetical protein
MSKMEGLGEFLLNPLSEGPSGSCCDCFIKVPCDSTGLGSIGAPSGVNKMKGVWGVLQNRYAIVTFHENPGFVRTVDLNDPANPIFLGTSVTIDNAPNGSKVKGNYFYTATNTGKLYVVNVSNPASLSITGVVQPFVNSQMFDVDINDSETYAYLANTVGKGLLVIDITNKNSPSFVTNVGFAAGGVRTRGDYVYITKYDSSTAFRIYDVSTPSSPTLVGSVGGFNFPVPIELHPTDDVAYVGGYNTGNLYAVDVSDPSNPVVHGNVTITGDSQPNFGSINFDNDNQIMIVSTLNGYVTLLSIIDPLNPVILCTYNLGIGSPVERIQLFQDYLLIPDRNGASVDIFRVNELSKHTCYSPYDIIVQGSISSLTNPIIGATGSTGDQGPTGASSADSISYTDGTSPTAWTGTAPTTVQEAIDRIAQSVNDLLGGGGIP